MWLIRSAPPILFTVGISSWLWHKRFDDWTQRLEELKADLTARLEELRTEMNRRFDELNARSTASQ